MYLRSRNITTLPRKSHKKYFPYLFESTVSCPGFEFVEFRITFSVTVFVRNCIIHASKTNLCRRQCCLVANSVHKCCSATWLKNNTSLISCSALITSSSCCKLFDQIVYTIDKTTLITIVRITLFSPCRLILPENILGTTGNCTWLLKMVDMGTRHNSIASWGQICGIYINFPYNFVNSIFSL